MLSFIQRSWNLRYAMSHASADWLASGSMILKLSVLETAIGADFGQIIQFIWVAFAAGVKPPAS